MSSPSSAGHGRKFSDLCALGADQGVQRATSDVCPSGFDCRYCEHWYLKDDWPTDRRPGERFVLTFEAALLFVICLGYAFSADIFSFGVAAVIIAGCYVIDNSMAAVEMARSTYLRKIAVDISDVTPTLSTGVSLQHIASMVIPVFGGLLWAVFGYQAVFMGAAVIAFLNFTLSRRIKIEPAPAIQPE